MEQIPGDFNNLLKDYEAQLGRATQPFYMDAADLLDIMDFYTKEGRTYDAETCLRHALKLHPDNEEVLLMKAYSLKDSERWEEAKALTDSLTDQECRGVKMFRVEILLNDGEVAEALKLLEDFWLSQPTQDYDICVEAAELLMDYGYTERALQWLNKIPYRDKHISELIAECHYQMEDYAKAVEVLNKALDKDPYDDITWTQLAEVQYKSATFSEAIDSCDYALAIRPDSEQALRLKTLSLLSLGNYEAAQKYGEEYIRKKPSDYSVSMMLGEALYLQEKLHPALKFLKKADAHCPQSEADKLRIISGITCLYAGIGNFSLAYETLNRTTMMGTSYCEICLQVAGLCLNSNGRGFAMDLLQKVISSPTLSADQTIRMAALLCESGCFKEAADIWQQISDRRPIVGTGLFPYLAVAERALGNNRAFLVNLTVACAEEPTLTQFLFRKIYPGKRAFEYEDAARAELTSLQ